MEFARNNKQYIDLKRQIASCNQNEEPIVVFVTKMQPFSSRIYDMATKAQERS